MPGATVLRASAVLTPAAVLAPGEVVVEAGRVVAVRVTRHGPPAPAGTVLAPGFVDLQVNGAGPTAALHATTDAQWAALGAAVAAGGTTTWCPTLVSAPEAVVTGALRAVAGQTGRRPGRPEVAGAHLEGPFLAVPGAHRPQDLRPAVPPGWPATLPAAVRVVTLAPELPGALEAVAALAARGVLVALGHSACSAETAAEAAGAGARLVTHLGNAMGVIHQRRPGLFGAALVDRRLAVSVIADGEHLHPDWIRLAFLAKGPERVVLVTDRVADTGLHPDGGRSAGPPGGARSGPDDVAGARPGGGLARSDRAGVLTGTVATQAALVARCAALPGVGLQAAVTAASATPARLLDLGDRGRLAPGRRADVVGLVHRRGRWALRAVWIDGRPLAPFDGRPTVASPWWASPPPSASTP